eukprot:4139504-Prymnesium_polylepis.1
MRGLLGSRRVPSALRADPSTPVSRRWFEYKVASACRRNMPSLRPLLVLGAWAFVGFVRFVRLAYARPCLIMFNMFRW